MSRCLFVVYRLKGTYIVSREGFPMKACSGMDLILLLWRFLGVGGWTLKIKPNQLGLCVEMWIHVHEHLCKIVYILYSIYVQCRTHICKYVFNHSSVCHKVSPISLTVPSGWGALWWLWERCPVCCSSDLCKRPRRFCYQINVPVINLSLPLIPTERLQRGAVGFQTASHVSLQETHQSGCFTQGCFLFVNSPCLGTCCQWLIGPDIPYKYSQDLQSKFTSGSLLDSRLLYWWEGIMKGVGYSGGTSCYEKYMRHPLQE